MPTDVAFLRDDGRPRVDDGPHDSHRADRDDGDDVVSAHHHLADAHIARVLRHRVEEGRGEHLGVVEAKGHGRIRRRLRDRRNETPPAQKFRRHVDLDGREHGRGAGHLRDLREATGVDEELEGRDVVGADAGVRAEQGPDAVQQVADGEVREAQVLEEAADERRGLVGRVVGGVDERLLGEAAFALFVVEVIIVIVVILILMVMVMIIIVVGRR